MSHGTERIDVEHDGEIGLVLNMTTGHQVSGRIDRQFCAETPVVNSVTVMPPGRRFRFEIEGECRVLALTLPIADLDDEVMGEGMVRPRVNVVDIPLAALVWRTATSTEEARPAALMELAAYLYHPPDSQCRRIVGGLPLARLRRVTDAVESGLAGSLPLAYLGLKPNQRVEAEWLS